MRQRQSTTSFVGPLIDTGITVSLTTFENHVFLRDNLGHLLSSALVREIVISDDSSSNDRWNAACNDLVALATSNGFMVSASNDVPENPPQNPSQSIQTFFLTRGFDVKTLILSRNTSRLGGFRNKEASIELSSSSWVLLLDADNVIPEKSLFALAKLRNLRSSEIYCPSQLSLFTQTKEPGASHATREKRQLAWPYLLFGEPLRLRFFSNLLESKSAYIRSQAGFFLNTGNFLVHRDAYLICARQLFGESRTNPMAADVVAFSSRWLKSGGAFVLVEGFRYFHRVHDSSFWASTESSQHARAEERRIASLEVDDPIDFSRRWYPRFRMILWAFAIPSDAMNSVRRFRKKVPNYLPRVLAAFRRNS